MYNTGYQTRTARVMIRLRPDEAEFIDQQIRGKSYLEAGGEYCRATRSSFLRALLIEKIKGQSSGKKSRKG